MAEKGERHSESNNLLRGSVKGTSGTKLADLGVTKKQSHNWQKVALLDDDALPTTANKGRPKHGSPDGSRRQGFLHRAENPPSQAIDDCFSRRDGEAAQSWRVLAFSAEAQNELLRLDDGDAVSVQGGRRAEAYSKDGEARVGLTVIADAVLPLRCARKRQPRESERQAAHAYDDAIPF